MANLEEQLAKSREATKKAKQEAAQQKDPAFTRQQFLEAEEARYNKYLDSIGADLSNWKKIVLDLETPLIQTKSDGMIEKKGSLKLRCRVPSMADTQEIDQMQALQLIGYPNLNLVSNEVYTFAAARAALELLAVPDDQGKFEPWVQTVTNSNGELRPDFGDSTPAAYRPVIIDLYRKLEVFTERFLGWLQP